MSDKGLLSEDGKKMSPIEKD